MAVSEVKEYLGGDKSKGARLSSVDDAEAIAGLFDSSYTNYPFLAFTDAAYYREILALSSEERGFESFVAVNDGKVIGHAGLVYHQNPLVKELGRLVIDKDHRSQGHASLLSIVRAEYAKIMYGTELLLTECISQHPGSQIVNERLDFKPVGWELGKYPDVFNIDQRESICLEINDGLANIIRDSVHCLFLPKDYHQMAKTVLDQFGAITLFKNGLWHSNMEAHISTNYIGYGIGKLTVQFPGQGLGEQIRNGTEDLLAQGAKYIDTDVNVEEAKGLRIIESLRKTGFFVAGILPKLGADGSTMLRMQMLSQDNEIDPSLLTCNAIISRNLLDSTISDEKSNI